MAYTPNDRFEDLIDFLKSEQINISQRTDATPEHKAFIKAFPASELTKISLQQYCIGTGSNDSFCWWLEVGLKNVMGYFGVGSADQNILYFKADGDLYKNPHLEDLSDIKALRYTLKIQSAIANAKSSDGLLWIDDDQEIYERAGVEPRVTVGPGRKLRLLSCYNSNTIIPISSTTHIGHFLKVFGLSDKEIPKYKAPVARMLRLIEIYKLAKKQIPNLSTYGFMTALYDPKLGISPKAIKEAIELEESNFEELETQGSLGLNTILYGPPGTGKTHNTINEALRVLEPALIENAETTREDLLSAFNRYKAAGQIVFCTFHQSFSYEDFVEGLRAITNDDKQLEYVVEPGVFKRLCDDARTQDLQPNTGIRSNPRIWKISINGTGPSPTKNYCLSHGEARIGWGATGDLSEPFSPNSYFETVGSGNQGTLAYFSNEIVPGDILLCIHSAEMIGAIGVVTGKYRYEEKTPTDVLDDYNHVLPVNWLYKDLKLSVFPLNDGKQFTLKTVYSMYRFTWGDLLAHLEESGATSTTNIVSVTKRKPYVLIIDEINRGNISRIFGELITLIEPSKRAGMPEALSTVLPYSKKPFSIPSNLYVIATMNTTDRSLAGMDIALRRRFTFKEMPPQYEELNQKTVLGINIGQLLQVINERIEVLLDRDHCLGHAYFIGLEDKDTLANLSWIFKRQILPLLQEYFFEDWERIAWVLNDQNKSSDHAFITKSSVIAKSLFGTKGPDNLQNEKKCWRINTKAFEKIDSYRQILGVTA